MKESPDISGTVYLLFEIIDNECNHRDCQQQGGTVTPKRIGMDLRTTAAVNQEQI